MKSCTLVTVLATTLAACSSPAPSGGGGGTGQQAIAPPVSAPAVDSRILGVWDFTGQLKGDSVVLCGRDAACYRESLHFTADAKLTMDSEQYGKLSCTFTTANEAVTYKCGNNAAVTNDYGFSDSGVTLCLWQNAGLAYCYTHR